MTRVCDYIADYVYKLGVEYVFMVSGGGQMFLTDGIAKHPHLKAICNHHEQAVAMAMISYSKYTENFGAAYITTGCGGTNTITGVVDAWQDNVPCLFISGQSKRKETVRNSGLKLRQFGVQEVDIIPIVESITKYSIMLNDPNEIAYHLDKAVYLAKTGRPGPVWLDVPLDVQGAMIDENNLIRFSPDELKPDYKTTPSKEEIDLIKECITASERPMIVVGQGVRLAKAIPEFRELIEKFKIPVVASRLGIDVLESDCDLYIGRIGTKGDRAGNFAVQNADLVIAIGSRLSVSSTGHEYAMFAREAKTIVVDIDPVEHKKNTVRIDDFINADAKELLSALLKEDLKKSSEIWTNTCLNWKEKWPVYIEEYEEDSKGINMYTLVDRLSKQLKDDSIVVSDAGSAFYVVSQGIMHKGNMRYITSGGQAEMGYTVPATIGVAVARGFKETIGITGDGSFQFNIQEMQTIFHYKLPIKMFVLNNDGYLSIRTTQEKFFEKRFIGTDSESGVSFPSLEKIAYAYNICYYKIEKIKDIDRQIKEILEKEEPVLVEVISPRDQEVKPVVSSMRKPDGTMVSKPIEDMYPFLDRQEFYDAMIVKPIQE
ncbi:MAG: acetolactate synthase large subunit [Bacteroidota bacterium]|nr:acetolactate synthase large subunit [Bacteroidota bacterium]